MKSKVILPLCDLVFLALGGVLMAMTQMEVVHAIPVEITQIGKGAAVVQHEKFRILTVTANGLNLDGKPVTEQQLVSKTANQKVVLRVYKNLPTHRTVNVIAQLAQAGAQVSIEVQEQNNK